MAKYKLQFYKLQCWVFNFMSILATRCHSFTPLAPQLRWTEYNHRRICVSLVKLLWLIVHSWDFKDILKHLIGIEFPIMNLTRSTCCTCHWAWKSAHQAETKATWGARSCASGSEPGTERFTFASINWPKIQIFWVHIRGWTGDHP